MVDRNEAYYQLFRDMREGMYFIDRYEDKTRTGPPDREYHGEPSQLIKGLCAGFEKYIFEDPKEAQELINRYGGTFIEGVRLAAAVCEHEPTGTEFEFTQTDTIEKGNFTFVQ